MTPETEALIARVRELHGEAETLKGWDQIARRNEANSFAPQLATALEAESKRAEFWKTALDAEYARRIDAEKRADALQDDKDVLTGQLQEARRRTDTEHERAEVLQSQVDNADTNLEQVRMIWKARADAAEAKLKVAREAFAPVRGWIEGSIPGRRGDITVILWKGECERITAALTQLEP